ncbi:hypothetical protein CPB84DRAFT_1849826 [Gymnopilus junonius]|uniref:Uncharacterized protein n=1 Tax=Gymnopilus junonius TaxID=109634 RepID=A0A9P5TJA2_GYMJU|nr:hypothetical protein CPB84DRAFT_1849826 [Gymnopilus junonius]
MTLLPYLLFCLTHLVLVVGIHSNTFKAGYKSIDEILHCPNLENIDYIHLEWREDFLNKPIFPMSYSSFLRNLQCVLLIAGFSTMAHLYAFHIGAFIEYNKSLTQAMCGQSNEPLLEVMRDLSKQNDSGTPLEVTREQKLSIESRRDITERQAALDDAMLTKDKGKISKAKSTLDKQKCALYKLILLKA